MESLPADALATIVNLVLWAEHSSLARLAHLRLVSHAWRRLIDSRHCDPAWRTATRAWVELTHLDTYGSLAPGRLPVAYTPQDVARATVAYTRQHRLALEEARKFTDWAEDCEQCLSDDGEPPPRPLPASFKPLLSATLRSTLCATMHCLMQLLGLVPLLQAAGGPQWAHKTLQRYQMWLALKKRHPGALLVPPADVEIAHVSHVLRTRAYWADCEAMGLSPDHTLLLRGHGEQLLFNGALEATQAAWHALFPHASYVDAVHEVGTWFFWNAVENQVERNLPPAFCTSLGTAVEPGFDSAAHGVHCLSLTAADLEVDTKWLRDLKRDISNSVGLPWHHAGFNEHRISWAAGIVNSYERWLWLVSKYPKEALAPHVIVDLAWHAHQMDPVAYRTFCEAKLGRFVAHNMWASGPGVSKSPNNAIEQLWMKEFGVRMFGDNKKSLFRGPSPPWRGA